jgi:hypothetical protein
MEAASVASAHRVLIVAQAVMLHASGFIHKLQYLVYVP